MTSGIVPLTAAPSRGFPQNPEQESDSARLRCRCGSAHGRSQRRALRADPLEQSLDHVRELRRLARVRGLRNRGLDRRPSGDRVLALLRRDRAGEAATRSSRTARSRCSTTRAIRTAGSGWTAGEITPSGCRSIRSCCSARTRGSGAIRGGRSPCRSFPSIAAPRRSFASSRDTFASGRRPDELWVEETLLEILARLAPAAEPRRTRRDSPARPRRPERAGAPVEPSGAAVDGRVDREGRRRIAVSCVPGLPAADGVHAARLSDRAAAAPGACPPRRRADGPARDRGGARVLEPQPLHGALPRGVRDDAVAVSTPRLAGGRAGVGEEAAGRRFVEGRSAPYRGRDPSLRSG